MNFERINYNSRIAEKIVWEMIDPSHKKLGNEHKEIVSPDTPNA